MQNPRISIIAALGKHRAIGLGNELLWHIPDDLKRFKALTLGHPVIMGRKTFESVVATIGMPLPERKNIIITRSPHWYYPHEDVVAANSIEDALAQAKLLDSEEIFIGGGTQIYEQALAYADRLYLTLIDDEKEGDAFFPPYENMFTKKLSEESRDWNGLKYTWVTLEKI